MKRYHKMTLGDRTLKLSLSFGTSLKILDEVASPTQIVESVLKGYQAMAQGNFYEGEFVFNERNSVQIVYLANREFDNLEHEEIGAIAIEVGFLNFYGEVLTYLNELVMGRSKEVEEPKEEDEPAEKLSGQSS